MALPIPSSYDDKGPLFVKLDVEHATKRKLDGITPSVSIKGVPIGGRLQLDGPGDNDQPVIIRRFAASRFLLAIHLPKEE